MACLMKQALIEEISKRLIPELRASFPTLGGPALKAKALDAATKLQSEIERTVTQDVLPISREAIQANASTAIPAATNKLPLVRMSKEHSEMNDKAFSNAALEIINESHLLED